MPNKVFTIEFPTPYRYEFKKMIFFINGKEYKSFPLDRNEANRIIINKRRNGKKIDNFIQDIYLEESIFKDSHWISDLKALGKGKDSQIVFKDEEGFSHSITLNKGDKDTILKAISYYEKKYQSVYTNDLEAIFFNL